jgi:hypothetical protein
MAGKNVLQGYYYSVKKKIHSHLVNPFPVMCTTVLPKAEIAANINVLFQESSHENFRTTFAFAFSSIKW